MTDGAVGLGLVEPALAGRSADDIFGYLVSWGLWATSMLVEFNGGHSVAGVDPIGEGSVVCV